MSTINVDTILPNNQSMVTVNNVNIGKNENKSIQLTSGPLKNVTNSVLVGDESGQNLSTGFNNTFVGKNAGKQTTEGNQNTFFGSTAGTGNQTGSFNTFVGSSAGQQNLQDGNTFIGWNAGSTAVNTINSMCLGANAQPSVNNAFSEITLGNQFVETLRCATTSITSLSDARDKKEVKELPIGLDFVNQLKPVSFVWDERSEEGKHDIKDFGFIAQDLKKAQEDAKLADTLKLVYEANPEKLEASYGKLIPILVKAIQDLSAKVEALEKK
jgi:hypothetical protein